jgi:dihydropteroate synthase
VHVYITHTQVWVSPIKLANPCHFSSRQAGRQADRQTETLTSALIQRHVCHESMFCVFIHAVLLQVAKEAVLAGANMINDVSGGLLDPNMFATAAALQVFGVLL